MHSFVTRSAASIHGGLCRFTFGVQSNRLPVLVAWLRFWSQPILLKYFTSSVSGVRDRIRDGVEVAAEQAGGPIEYANDSVVSREELGTNLADRPRRPIEIPQPPRRGTDKMQ